MVGGVVVAGAAIAGIIYALTKSSTPSSSALAPSPGGGGGGGGGGGTKSSGVTQQMLDDTVSTLSGPDYGYDLIFGGWILVRERANHYPNLGPGSAVHVKMYPDAIGHSAMREYGLQITKAFPLASFTIYQAKWSITPGGLDPNEPVFITSADISSVSKVVPRS